MAIQEMAFVPATGWNDPTTFPEKVNNASDVRDMLQLLHDQTKDYLNDTVKPAIDNLQAGTIPTGKIENGAVTTAKIADGNVTTAKIADGNVTDAKIASGITASKISGALSNATIAGSSVTGTVAAANIGNLPTSKITSGTFGDSFIASGISASKISGALSNATIAGSAVTGTVAAANIGNLDASKITSGTFADARIPSLNASKTTAGTFADARIPSLAASKITSGTFDVARIPNLSATKITSDTLSADRIPALGAGKITSGTFDAARIPSLDASKIGSGTVAIARLPYETSLTASSDAKLPTSKAVSTYVTSLLTSGQYTKAAFGTFTGSCAQIQGSATSVSALPNVSTLSRSQTLTVGFAPAVVILGTLGNETSNTTASYVSGMTAPDVWFRGLPHGHSNVETMYYQAGNNYTVRGSAAKVTWNATGLTWTGGAVWQGPNSSSKYEYKLLENYNISGKTYYYIVLGY